MFGLVKKRNSSYIMQVLQRKLLCGIHVYDAKKYEMINWLQKSVLIGTLKLLSTLTFSILLLSCADQRNSSPTTGNGLMSAMTSASGGDSVSIAVDVIATNLDVPWEIVWGPDNWIWYTEKGGSISKLNPLTSERKLLLHLPEVVKSGTKGLLCMAIHPDFGKFPYVVVNYHYMKDRRVKKDF